MHSGSPITLTIRHSTVNSLMAVSNTTRIVMLGKTGTGKSSLANTIFGEKLFGVDHSPNSETRECRAETKSVNGRSITLIDTPGFLDTDRSEEEMKPEIVRCITECAPGPHVFLIVLKVEKHTKHEQAVITEINQYFTEEVFKYATVLFTHGDQLDEGQTIEDFVHQNTILSDLIKKCGGRCHVVDNKYWKNNQQDEYRNNQFQVEQLLKSIDKTLLANKGSYYTNEMLQTVEEEIQQEMEHIRQSSGKISEEEIREQAKDRVSKDILIKLAGITTGALLGALFGVFLVVGKVVTVLKKSLSEPGQALTKIAAVTARGVIAGTTAGVAMGGTATVGGVIGGTAALGEVIGGTAVVGGVIGGTAALGEVIGGTAVVGGVIGGTAAGEAIGGTAAVTAAGITAGAVGTAIGIAAGVCAAAGAVTGGLIGYDAAEGANTPQEAAKRAAKAVTNEALSPFKALGIKVKDKTESKPLLSPDS